MQYQSEQQRWAAIVERDSAAVGQFWYAVITTGIYCEPGCSSRLPHREHVRFFESWQTAEEAGFRACKRCEPTRVEHRYQHAIEQACRTIMQAPEEPSLTELAMQAGLSPTYFQRVFKRLVGISPKQYALQVRLQRVQHELFHSETVTEALYEAGYGSSSHFYTDVTTKLGMTPTTYQAGGVGMHMYLAQAQAYLGWLVIAATEQGICAIELGADPEVLKQELASRFPEAQFEPANQQTEVWLQTLIMNLEQPAAAQQLPLEIQGTAFQQRVWSVLQAIPAGETISYSELAERIGSPKAVRAVAQACGANTLAIAIPCHRVVRSDGSLGGYRWGIERKQQLLDREAQ